jgi:hypothetical protein
MKDGYFFFFRKANESERERENVIVSFKNAHPKKLQETLTSMY